MTPDARMVLREALGQVKQSLIQADASMTTAMNTTTVAPPAFSAPTDSVAIEPDASGQWKKCVNEEPVNCGLLHDIMSLEWGKFRDLYDALKMKIKLDYEEYLKMLEDYNLQIQTLTNQKAKYEEIQADAISQIQTDQQALKEKEVERDDLQGEWEKKCAEYRAEITEILYTRICATRKVRDEVMTYSTVTPPDVISDCDFTDWDEGGSCFANGVEIECDDKCPDRDPNVCGGSETLNRDIVTQNNDYGMKCPALSVTKKCNQFKCPVDCVLSQWEGWTRCSAECDGGIETHSRRVITKALNGGTWCDTVMDTITCNTQNCDEDCVLADWSQWSFCDMACNGGMKTMSRKVLLPTKGDGECPGPRTPVRYREGGCNEQRCTGDEVCTAIQDLVIALDGSGSVKQDGFETLRNFAVNLTKSYRGRWEGTARMKLGAVFFGNGDLIAPTDGGTEMTIKPAITVSTLTFQMEEVRRNLEATQWLRGFTNLAQALSLADTVLNRGGRAEAQSAVLVLSDGKFSFKWQTGERVKELKDKGVKLFMVPVTTDNARCDGAMREGPGGDPGYLCVLRQFASEPWETNYERIPGLMPLKTNMEYFIHKIVVKFCPDAWSPERVRADSEEGGFTLIRAGGYPNWACADAVVIGTVESLEACMEASVALGWLGFSFDKGSDERENRCFAEQIPVTMANWESWLENATDVPCPGGGKWVENPYFDTYVVRPRV